MPMQYMVSGNCVARSHRYADKALSVMFNPVGQVVGQLNSVEKTAAVVQRLVEEYLDAVDGLNALMTDA
jgi:NAD(P)H-dependent flavin oxidoreductase YrpB (nitropropane dioxygenase family)